MQKLDQNLCEVNQANLNLIIMKMGTVAFHMSNGRDDKGRNREAGSRREGKGERGGK